LAEIEFMPPFEMAVGTVSIGGKGLPPQQKAVGLQQWQQDRVGWRLAGTQLPPIETAVSCSLPPLQNAVGVFLFFFFLFGFCFFSML
jgi:hypothetical protein